MPKPGQATPKPRPRHAKTQVTPRQTQASFSPGNPPTPWVNQASEILALLLLSSSPGACLTSRGVPPPLLTGLPDASWRLLATALLLTWLRSLQFDAILLPMAPQMEPNWVPNLPDFPKCENLDFGDPSHSLEGPRVSDLNQFAPQI